jgi:hypothetical protein
MTDVSSSYHCAQAPVGPVVRPSGLRGHPTKHAHSVIAQRGEGVSRLLPNSDLLALTSTAMFVFVAPSVLRSILVRVGRRTLSCQCDLCDQSDRAGTVGRSRADGEGGCRRRLSKPSDLSVLSAMPLTAFRCFGRG